MKINKYINRKTGMLLIVVLGLIIRLVSLNQSFWLDETTSGYIARDFNFDQIVLMFSPGDFNPPLYYFILKIWGMVFGYSEVALRGLSVTAGISSIFVIYKIIIELGLKTDSKTRSVAYLTAILLATSGLHIYFSQEARMYMLASFFVLLSFYFFVKIIIQSRVENHHQFKDGYKYFLGYSSFLTMAIFTHYQTIFMIPVYFLAGLIYRKSFGWWTKFIASHIILVAVFLIWSPIIISQLGLGIDAKDTSPAWWQVLGKTDLKQIALLPVKFIIGRVSFENQILYAVFGLTLTLLYLWIIIKSLEKSSKFKIIWVWFLLPIALSAVIGLKLSIFTYFRLLFVLPAFYMLISLGIYRTKPGLKFLLTVFVVGVNLIFSSAYLFNNRFHRENWRGAIDYVINHNDVNSKTIVVFPAPTGTEAFKYYDPNSRINIQVGADGVLDYDIIWLVRYAQPIFDPYDFVKINIENAGYHKKEEVDFSGVVMWRYKKI